MFLQKLKPVVRKAIAEDRSESEEDDNPIGNTDEESGDELGEEVEDQEQVMTDEQAEFMEQDIKDHFFCNL